MATPVIFRKFEEDNEVIAIFTATKEGKTGRDFLSYMHNGQHGTANIGIVEITLSASPEEYAPLLKELVSIGYDDLVTMNGEGLNV